MPNIKPPTLPQKSARTGYIAVAAGWIMLMNKYTYNVTVISVECPNTVLK